MRPYHCFVFYLFFIFSFVLFILYFHTQTFNLQSYSREVSNAKAGILASNCSPLPSLSNLNVPHMVPLHDGRLMWLQYWNTSDPPPPKTGSSPSTPRPRTVFTDPLLIIRQWRSCSRHGESPRFSTRTEYRHQYSDEVLLLPWRWLGEAVCLDPRKKGMAVMRISPVVSL